MSKDSKVQIRPVTREQVVRVQNSMRDVIDKVNRDVDEYMKRAQVSARKFATAKR